MRKLIGLFATIESLLLVIFSFSNIKAAEAKVLRISGFKYPRNFIPLLNDAGGQPAYSNGTEPLYNELNDPNNFGANGIIKCSPQFIAPFSEIVSGSLVEPDGTLKLDIFFAGPNKNLLTEIEALELTKFVISGGILYISGGPYAPYEGINYNPLFAKLEITDVFGTTKIRGALWNQSQLPILNTKTTNGPFGNVTHLRYSSYTLFQNNTFDTIVFGANGLNGLIFEKQFGSGYIAIDAEHIYMSNADGNYWTFDNRSYFLNLFAMGCKDANTPTPTPTPPPDPTPTPTATPTSTPTPIPPTLLNVPSFKQGLKPYDGVDPVWENNIYDDGNKQTLWCGSTIKQCGCAMTSASMIMAYNSVNYDPVGNVLNPQSVNNYFSRDSKKVSNYYVSYGYSYGNLLWNRVGNLTALANKIYPLQPKLDQAVIENYDEDKLKGYIDSGIPVILKVKTSKGGTHWVVVKGYKENNFIVNDPATPDPSPNNYSTLASLNYTPQFSRSMVHYIQTHSDFSSLEIVSPSNIKILVTDPFGQKTGFDPVSSNIFEQIPGSQYLFDESYVDPTEENPTPPEGSGVYDLIIQKPQAGYYKVQIAPGTNGANFVIYSSDSIGNISFYPFSFKPNSSMEFLYDPTSQNDNLYFNTKIDIEPWTSQNKIFMRLGHPVLVGVFSGSSFDATTQVNRKSLTFGKSGDEKSLILCLDEGIDINRDRLKDLLCLFNPQKTGLTRYDTQGTLKAKSINYPPIVGRDKVKISF